MKGLATALAIVFVSAMIAATSLAQTTIPEPTYSDGQEVTFTSMSDTLGMAADTASAQTLYDASGANQNWDFTVFVFDDTLTFTQTYLQLPAGTPGEGDPNYDGADIAAYSRIIEDLDSDGVDDTTEFWIYQALDNGDLLSYGSVTASTTDGDMNGEPDSARFWFDPPATLEKFPVQFGNMWEDSTGNWFDAMGMPFNTSYEETSHNVDGWGSLTTPDGGPFDALRIHTTTVTTGLLGFPNVTTTTGVSFVTNEGISAAISRLEDGEYLPVIVTTDGGGGGGTAIEKLTPANGYILEQNFPNPFGSYTSISYEIPNPAPVKLSVFDIMGREVRILVDGTKTAGRHSVVFDRTDLPSGVYFYRMETGGGAVSRLMTVVK